MNRFGEMLKKIRTERGMSQEELAQLLGTSKQVISRYENGLRTPKITIAAEYARILGVDIVDFSGEATQMPSNIIPLSPVTRVPVLGTIAAGEPITANQEYDEYIEVPADCSCADAAVRVQGDSMFPHYHNGDYVFIRFQPDVEDGEIAAVVIDDTAALKRLYHIKGGALLQSENPAYKPMTFTAENSNSCRIIGKAVGFLRWE